MSPPTPQLPPTPLSVPMRNSPTRLTSQVCFQILWVRTISELFWVVFSQVFDFFRASILKFVLVVDVNWEVEKEETVTTTQ